MKCASLAVANALGWVIQRRLSGVTPILIALVLGSTNAFFQSGARADVTLVASSLTLGEGQTVTDTGPGNSPLSVLAFGAPAAGVAEASFDPGTSIINPATITLAVHAAGSLTFTNADTGLQDTFFNHGGAGISYTDVITPSIGTGSFVTTLQFPTGSYFEWQIFFNATQPQLQAGDGLNITVGVNHNYYTLNDTLAALNPPPPPIIGPPLPPGPAALEGPSTADLFYDPDVANNSPTISLENGVYPVTTIRDRVPGRGNQVFTVIDRLPPSGTFPLSFAASIEATTNENFSFSDPWVFTIFDPSGSIISNLSFNSQAGAFYDVTDGATTTPATVPEPGSFVLLGTALAGISLLGGHRRLTSHPPPGQRRARAPLCVW